MHKVALVESMSKQYLNLRHHARRNTKAVSYMKLVFVLSIFFVVLGIYALYINEGSTKGYFLKQEMNSYKTLEFDRSIAELDVLLLEKDLWAEVNENRYYRYDHDSRVVTVPTYLQGLASK